ncbi:hypothetical protein DENSPDRAFT_845195 [Dentipellis sp. KUC8613]|nr:hypothetical protein DENSPDRAFT_845195 [Dentipellis sp. KUC8613]
MASHSQKDSISSSTDSNPGLMSDTDSIASYGLTSAVESTALNKSVLEIISNRTLSDADLHDQAKKHLQILTRPSFESYNVPKWVARVPLPVDIDSHKFNMKNLFDAMYQTASDLKLASGARYVSAAICACATRAAEQPQEKQVEQLAAELCKLGGTWVAYMLWPFIGNSKPPDDLVEHSDVATPTYDRTASVMDEGNTATRRGHFRTEVMKRDNYTCILTGVLDKSAPLHLRTGELSRVKLEAAHIMRRSVTVFRADNTDNAKRASLASTYDILKHYCELDDKFAETMSQMDGAQNGVLLDKYAHDAFDDFGFCFQAEEAANTYKVKAWIPEKEISTVPIASKITFKDHSQTLNTAPAARRSGHAHSQPDDSIPLPSPQLLQLHAALAGVLNMSGAAEILQVFQNPPGSDGPAVQSDYGDDFESEVIQYDGDKISVMRDLTGSVGRLAL